MNTILKSQFIKVVILLGFLSILPVIQSCATLSKGECIEADWYEIGAKDGANGRPTSRLDDHREACKKHDVSPNREQYYMGREEGIQIYCTRKNGFNVGYNGNYYSGACPIDLEQDFLAGFKHGQKIYKVKQNIASNDREIDKLEKELSEEKTKQERRKEIRNEIRHLDQNNMHLRDDLRVLENRYKY